jgi:hypothetical protein
MVMVEPIIVKRSEARDRDILCCRGNGVLSHPGNIFYLQLIKQYQQIYQRSDQPLSAKEKRIIVTHIVDVIEASDPPGRFLRLVGKQSSVSNIDGTGGVDPAQAEELFHVIQDRDSRMKKVSQALREKPKKTARETRKRERIEEEKMLLIHKKFHERSLDDVVEQLHGSNNSVNRGEC